MGKNLDSLKFAQHIFCPAFLFKMVHCAFVSGMSDIKHDVTNDIVVQAKSSLLRKLGQKSNQFPNDLKCFDGIFPSELFHEKFQKQVAVLHQARTNYLVCDLINCCAVQRDGMIIQ